MRVAIIGSRNAPDVSLEEVLARIPDGCCEIISGGARGVDALAERAAAALGLPFVEIEPDYERFGRRAPLERNARIVDRADLVLAFWDFASRGTADAIAKCIESGTRVEVVGLGNLSKFDDDIDKPPE